MRHAGPGVVLFVLLSLTGVEPRAAASGGAAAVDSVQGVVDEFRGQLGLTPTVRVVLVDENPRVVSVARDSAVPDVFVLSFERAFLDELSGDELRAVVAHELGHVWIFGNHPYLQTEQRANEVALRLVPSEDLASAYRKLDALTGRSLTTPRR
jgi:hypothetical protein